MTNAIILHGKPSVERYTDLTTPMPHEADWLPWLAQTLGHFGIATTVPALPEPHSPVYENCIREVLETPITEHTLAVGYNMGAGLLVRWMSESPDAVIKKLVLVAPWLDPNRRYRSLFDFVIDPKLTERCVNGITIFDSTTDGKEVKRSTDILVSAFPDAKLRSMPKYRQPRSLGKARSNKFYPIIGELL